MVPTFQPKHLGFKCHNRKGPNKKLVVSDQRTEGLAHRGKPDHQNRIIIEEQQNVGGRKKIHEVQGRHGRQKLRMHVKTTLWCKLSTGFKLQLISKTEVGL